MGRSQWRRLLDAGAHCLPFRRSYWLHALQQLLAEQPVDTVASAETKTCSVLLKKCYLKRQWSCRYSSCCADILGCIIYGRSWIVTGLHFNVACKCTICKIHYELLGHASSLTIYSWAQHKNGNIVLHRTAFLYILHSSYTAQRGWSPARRTTERTDWTRPKQVKNKPYQIEARAERLLIFDPDAVEGVVVLIRNCTTREINYAMEKNWCITFNNYLHPEIHKTYWEVKRGVNMTMWQQSWCSRKWRRCDSDCIQHPYVLLAYMYLLITVSCCCCNTGIALLLYVVALLALLVHMNKTVLQQVHRTKDDCVKFKLAFTGDASKQTFMDSMTYRSMNAVTN